MKSKVIGLSESRSALKQLGPAVEKKVLNIALMTGAREIVRAIQAQAQAPRRLKAAAAAKTATRAAPRNDIIPGDVYTGFRSPHHRLAHLIEFGTRPRIQKKTGRYTGVMPAKPFVRPAVDQSKDTAERKVRDAIGRGVEREATRLGAGNKAIK